MNLTDLQKQILDLISQHIKDHGYPPTRQEICALLGFTSPNSAECHLRALEKKGAIKMTPGKARGISLPGGYQASPSRKAAVLANLPATSPELAALDGCTVRDMNAALQALKKSGLVFHEKKVPRENIRGGYPWLWELTEKGKTLIFEKVAV